MQNRTERVWIWTSRKANLRIPLDRIDVHIVGAVLGQDELPVSLHLSVYPWGQLYSNLSFHTPENNIIYISNYDKGTPRPNFLIF
jgi:hypothetical protein